VARDGDPDPTKWVFRAGVLGGFVIIAVARDLLGLPALQVFGSVVVYALCFGVLAARPWHRPWPRQRHVQHWRCGPGLVRQRALRPTWSTNGCRSEPRASQRPVPCLSGRPRSRSDDRRPIRWRTARECRW